MEGVIIFFQRILMMKSDKRKKDSTGRLRLVEVPPFVRLSNDWRIVQKNIVVILNQFMRQIKSTLRLSLFFILYFVFKDKYFYHWPVGFLKHALRGWRYNV